SWDQRFGTWRANMSTTKFAILSSILLSGAVAMPAIAKAVPPQHRVPHVPSMHFAGRFAEPPSNTAGHNAEANVRKPARLDSGNYTIIDLPNVDPSWGTRVVGINESDVLSGYYLNKDDGKFHAYLLPTNG